MAAALGRQVEVGSVHIRLLPRPGFDLENLVVYDDSAFGAEPMLRAEEVTAVLRLTSLARGRIEIARLDLTDPSLNIVHGDSGGWNLAALVERTAHTPLAPTAKARSGPRPAFPYIEATGARINFKSGREKKPYALTNADFSLWQDSENTWGVRLKAQPFRSDMNLNDTGILRVNGTWQRAATLRETPMQFSVEWDRPQLGQLTKFFTGRDKGWRGGAQLEVALTGTPLKLQISGDASVRDFRRYDISSSEPLQLAAHCQARYTSLDHGLHDILCQGPAGAGSINLSGEMGLPGSHLYALTLATENLPAAAIVALAQRVKKNLPDDLVASGSARGSFSIHGSDAAGGGTAFEGRGELVNFRLTSEDNKAEWTPGNISFGVKAGSSTAKVWNKVSNNAAAQELPFANEMHLEVDPFPVALGRSAPATARLSIARSGYSISLTGDSEVSHAVRIAHLFGMPVTPAALEGPAQLDLKIAGWWTGEVYDNSPGFPPAQMIGTIRLHNVRASSRGLEGPVEITSAELQLLPNQVRVSKLTANVAHTTWTGSLEFPRGCGTASTCPAGFNLNANELNLTELSRWLNPLAQPRPWYRLLTSAAPTGSTFLAHVHAAGKITVKRLLVHDLAVTGVTADVKLENAKLALSDLRGNLLGGRHRGDWHADFTVKPPVYTGSGTLSDISLEHLAETMKDAWIAGSASCTYHLIASGTTSVDFWQSADSAIQFDMRNGTLAHISLMNDAGALQVDEFQGRARLHEGKIEVKDAQLDSADGQFLVNGRTSLKQELDLRLTPNGEASSEPRQTKGYSITGTVTEPHVALVSNPETQAQLKP